MSYLAIYDAVPDTDVQQRVGLVLHWIDAEPIPFFEELRQDRPIFAVPGFTLITRASDIAQVLNDPATFSVRLYGATMDAAVGPYMLGRDYSDLNWKDKSIMRSMMSLDDLKRIAELVKDTVESALNAAQSWGEIELVDTVGRGVPLAICDRYFGFPGPDRESMKRWSSAFQTQFFRNLQQDPGITERANQAGKETFAYLHNLIAKRREELTESTPCPHEQTILDRLLLTDYPDGLGFAEDRLAINVAGLLIGAVETTAQATVQVIEQLLKRPDKLAEARAIIESDRFADYVWEALRFNPINPAVFRFCERETVIGGGTAYTTTIAQGGIVFACTLSAMFDDAIVSNPNDFSAGRAPSNYQFFGNDYHECLGKYVGQVMVVESVRTVLRRNVSLIEGNKGKIDFKGGPFPESFVVKLGAA